MSAGLPLKKLLSITVLLCISLSVTGVAEYSHLCSMVPLASSCSGCQDTSGCCDQKPGAEDDIPCCTSEFNVIQAELSPVTFQVNTNKVHIYQSDHDGSSELYRLRSLIEPVSIFSKTTERNFLLYRTPPDRCVNFCFYLI